MLRRVVGTRYVTPLREGGSLPGVIEADDLGTYVVKFRGAGQGPKALVAEVIAGELARRLGLPVPELVVLELDPVIARAEPDEEVQELLKHSGGDNLGMDFLPGAFGFDPLAHPVDPLLASRILWFDAFTENVDRSWRNPNLLTWHHGGLWLIDHGAALYFHHNWPRAGAVTHRPFKGDDHVLAPFATRVAEADATLGPQITAALLTEVLALVPDGWLAAPDSEDPALATPDGVRAAYRDHLLARAAGRDAWLPAGVAK